MRLLFVAALLALIGPVPAQTPPPASPTSPSQTSAASSAAAVPAGPPASLWNGLIGKPQIVGVTENGGKRYLGRVLSGDHGMYVVQTFHFAGPPHVTTRTADVVTNGQKAHTQTYTVGSGKHRRRVHVTTYTSVPGKKKRETFRTQTDTTIPDDQAVGLLLKGVAGATMTPREIADAPQMVAAKDVKYLQALSPPAKTAVAAPRTGASPFQAAPAAASRSAWTMATLWPSDAKLDGAPVRGGKRKERRK